MPTAPKVDTTEIGRVPLGDDDDVVVAIVRRVWPGASSDYSGRKSASVGAPAAVEVRRVPYPGDIVGGIVPDRARALADLISRAADQADPDGAPRAGASTSRGR